MQLVQRTIGNNTFVYLIHRSLCRISIKTLGQNRNQLKLIHVPEIGLALTECNPHITRANALVGPHSGRQDFLQFLPSGRDKYCGLRCSVAGETFRHDTASQPAILECLDNPLWDPPIKHRLFMSKLPGSTRDITLGDIWMSRDAVHGAEPFWDAKLYRQTIALRDEIHEKNSGLHLHRSQNKYANCKGVKNNTNFGQIAGIQEKMDTTCKQYASQ